MDSRVEKLDEKGINNLKQSNKIPWKRFWQWLVPMGCLIAGLAGIFPTQTLAWGPQGHRIVAEIAQQRVEPRVLRAIQDEFSINKLADVANWADQIKSNRKGTRPWHYTNISAGEFLYSRQRDCPEGNCVTEKILEFYSMLENPEVAGVNRKEALMFLIHFVGDIHQPLHLGNEDDRGGNNIEVKVHGDPTNLHAVWDHDLIQLNGKSLLKYATDLAMDISETQAETWVAPGVVGWGNESRKLALHQGYPRELNPQRKLSEDYLEAGRKTVANQLQKAGVRLAHLLTKIFKP